MTAIALEEIGDPTQLLRSAKVPRVAGVTPDSEVAEDSKSPIDCKVIEPSDCSRDEKRLTVTVTQDPESQVVDLTKDGSETANGMCSGCGGGCGGGVDLINHRLGTCQRAN